MKRTGGKRVNQRCSTIGWKRKNKRFETKEKSLRKRKPVDSSRFHRLSPTTTFLNRRTNYSNRSFEYLFVSKLRELKIQIEMSNFRWKSTILLNFVSFRSTVTSPVTKLFTGLVEISVLIKLKTIDSIRFLQIVFQRTFFQRLRKRVRPNRLDVTQIQNNPKWMNQRRKTFVDR